MKITYFNKKKEREKRDTWGDFGSKNDLKSPLFIDEEEETRVLLTAYKKEMKKRD